LLKVLLFFLLLHDNVREVHYRHGVTKNDTVPADYQTSREEQIPPTSPSFGVRHPHYPRIGLPPKVRRLPESRLTTQKTLFGPRGERRLSALAPSLLRTALDVEALLRALDALLNRPFEASNEVTPTRITPSFFEGAFLSQTAR
jgi:hypothetical protein